MTHADCLTGAAVESPRRLWARCLAQYRVFQSCAGPLAGTEMGVFAAAGTPYLALGGVARSRKREKCYRTIDIIEQIGGCRIRNNYGYSLGVQRSLCAAGGQPPSLVTEVAGRGQIAL